MGMAIIQGLPEGVKPTKLQLSNQSQAEFLHMVADYINHQMGQVNTEDAKVVRITLVLAGDS